MKPFANTALARLNVLAPLCLGFLGCTQDVAGSASQPRVKPVRVETLTMTSPTRRNRTMGLVSPYRRENVGFEVQGRVEQVCDVGVEVEGPVYDFASVEVREGDVIARIDPTRYRNRRAACELEIASAQSSLAAQQIELDDVASARVASARAQQQAARENAVAAQEQTRSARARAVLAEREFERNQNLLEQGVVTQSVVDRARSELDSALAGLSGAQANEQAQREQLTAQSAKVAEAEANVLLKQAQIAASQAQIAELLQQLEAATLDLQDCVLRAPYSGRVTRRYVSRGAFVGVGSPVIELTLIDPVKIATTLSAEDDRRVRPNDQVLLFPDGSRPDLAPWFGSVNEKSEAADSATRTFSVNAIVRNRRRLPPSGGGVPVVDEVMPVVEEFAGEGGPLFVSKRCLLEVEGKPHVLRLPGLHMNRPRARQRATTLAPELVPVTFGERRLEFLDRSLQEVVGDAFEAGQMLIRDPRPEHRERVTLESPAWELRPGDLIPVAFDLGDEPKGFYVPLRAVRELNGELWIYLVVEGKAQKVSVRAHETAGERRRITGEGLSEGAAVVVEGAHYLDDGDAVAVQGR